MKSLQGGRGGMQRVEPSTTERVLKFLQNEPAMMGAVANAIMMFLAMAVALNWFGLTPEQLEAIKNFLVVFLPIASLVVGGWIRQQVTPVADPHDNDGVELVRKEG